MAKSELVPLVETDTIAQEILQRLQNGEDFSTLAKEYSIHTPSKEKGGDLGFLRIEDLWEEFRPHILKLEIGQNTGSIESSQGYFILRKTDERLAAK